MKKVAIILLVVLLLCATLSLTACGNKLKSGQIRITIGDKSFIAELADTKAAKEFEKWVAAADRTIPMSSANAQLYGNVNGQTFTQQPDADEPMYAGDLTMEGDNRFTMFYGWGNINPTMTRIGKIQSDDVTAFTNAIEQAVAAAKSAGKSTISVTLSK